MVEINEAGKWTEFYKHHLNNCILPFWLSRSIDNEYGGYFTCFDNMGEKLVSQDKYTWSQGRMIWLFSKLSDMECLSGGDKEKYAFLAGQGAEFLMKNCLLENGNCTFVMSREGLPKPPIKGGDCDSSIYADCFVVIGLSKYAALVGNREVLDFACKLYKSIAGRIDSNCFKSEPYPVPAGYRPHGIPMILLNTSFELADAMDRLGHAECSVVDRRADECMYDILDNFAGQDSLIREMIVGSGGFVEDAMLGRFINPGHSMECMWFVIHQAMKKGSPDIVSKACGIIKKAMDIGWDNEYGGLLLFVDRDGGKPKGSIKGSENEKMVWKVTNDWDSKLWWTHSEALYSTLLAYCLTGENSFMEDYQKIFEYTFKTFPNPDRELGEWVQIRDRKGWPEQKLVALPVKDPFHIARNIIFIIELLQNG